MARGRPPIDPRDEPERQRQRRPAAPDREPIDPSPRAVDPSLFERAFCSLVSFERPKRLLDLIEEQREVLTCDCARFFEIAVVQFAPKHPHFRQAARCAEILSGHPAHEIICIALSPTEDNSTIELSVALRGSKRWDSTATIDRARLVSAWLEARGDS